MNVVINKDVLDGLSSLKDNSVELVITSPPYNIDIEYKNHSDRLKNNEYYEWLSEVWAECCRVLVRGGRICINIGENKRGELAVPPHIEFPNQLLKLGMLYRSTLIWNKNNAKSQTAWGSWMSPSNPHVIPTHEYILVFSKGDYKLDGDKTKMDITRDEFIKYKNSMWNFGTESAKKIGHPAPFPIELAARLIKFYTYQSNTVLDPFSGSGTVGVAAKKLDRNYILIDNCEEYCKIAEKRIEKAQLIDHPMLASDDESKDKYHPKELELTQVELGVRELART